MANLVNMERAGRIAAPLPGGLRRAAISTSLALRIRLCQHAQARTHSRRQPQRILVFGRAVDAPNLWIDVFPQPPHITRSIPTADSARMSFAAVQEQCGLTARLAQVSPAASGIHSPAVMSLPLVAVADEQFEAGIRLPQQAA